MRRIIISLILLVGFCSGTYPIYFKHIGMQEGLSQLSVMAIYQDNLGRMWFGTEEGISIYDGRTDQSIQTIRISSPKRQSDR